MSTPIDRSIFHRMRFAAQQLRAEDQEGSELPAIIGQAIVYGVESAGYGFTEEIAPGSCTETLERIADPAAENDCVCLVNHDPNLPVARTPDTLFLEETEAGLLTRALPPATTVARDLVLNVQAGIIKKMSFGFYILDEELVKRESGPHFVIKSIELFDVSHVTWPFYKDTWNDIEARLASQETSLEDRLKPHLEEAGRKDMIDRAAWLEDFQRRQTIKNLERRSKGY